MKSRRRWLVCDSGEQRRLLVVSLQVSSFVEEERYRCERFCFERMGDPTMGVREGRVLVSRWQE